MIRVANRKRCVMGVSNTEMRKAFELLGYRMELLHEFPRGKGPTFDRWSILHCAPHRDSVLLVNVTSHYIVVHGNQGIDNWTKVPVPLFKFPKPRRRVHKVFKVERVS